MSHDAEDQTVVADSYITRSCPSCYSGNLIDFYEVDGVPANSCVLFDSEAESLACPTGDIRLAFCSGCGFIHNRAFNPAKTEYSARYEETQGFSPTFSRFHRELAARLLERFDLHGKTIMEIGCGKGEFLLLLATLGGVRGIGVDPSARQDRIDGVGGADLVTLIPEYFRESHMSDDVAAIMCKMTLEHISRPAKLLNVLRYSLADRDDVNLFFQIPETTRILTECAFEDIYHEHCSYFTPGSLARLFRRCGFQVLDVTTEYDDQYLTIHARPLSDKQASAKVELLPIEEDIATLQALAENFSQRNSQLQRQWVERIEAADSAGKKILIWGSGSKAVSFMTSLNVGDKIAAVTDINPHRWNHFMPATGHRILAPAELTELQPDLVIAMNRIYQAEIQSDLQAVGLRPQLICL